MKYPEGTKVYGGDYREYAKCPHGGSVGLVGLAPEPGEFQSVHDLTEEDWGGGGKYCIDQRLGVYKIRENHRNRRWMYIAGEKLTEWEAIRIPNTRVDETESKTVAQAILFLVFKLFICRIGSV